MGPDRLHSGQRAGWNDGLILVAIPLPQEFSQTVQQVEASQQRYFELAVNAGWCAAPTWACSCC